MSYQIHDMPAQIAADLLQQASCAETATIGHRRQLGFMHRSIQCILTKRQKTAIAGTAVTLALPGQDSTLLHHIIQFLRPNDVLVIDRLGDERHACLGGGVACAIKATGCAGVVIDGPCTDLPEIEQYELPVWCRGVSPITTRLYDIGGAFNADIACGGAVVHPGDLIIADASGVLVMPPEEGADDIAWALQKQAGEPQTHQHLLAGKRLGDLSGASANVLAKIQSG